MATSGKGLWGQLLENVVQRSGGLSERGASETIRQLLAGVKDPRELEELLDGLGRSFARGQSREWLRGALRTAGSATAGTEWGRD